MNSQSVRLYLSMVMVVLLIIIGFGVAAAQQGKDREMVEKMTEKKITVCVGRLLVDLPADTEVSFSGARLGGIVIDVEKGYTDLKVANFIAEREVSLVDKLNEYERPSLEKRIVADAINFQATLLYSGREKPDPRMLSTLPVNAEEGITVEAYGIKNDFFYRFIGKNLSSPKYEENVLFLVKKFESRADLEVPIESGFCVENGLIHDPIPPDDNETVTMFASIKGFPDIAIRLDTSVLDEMQESLLVRNSKNDISTRFATNVKSLRRGARVLNGIAGEEVLNRFKEGNGTTGHMFMWESLGKPSDVLAPSITLELETGRGRPGAPVNSSFADEAVLELWRVISSSLRLRPITATKKLSIEKIVRHVALGELAATGRTCPQTGYWQCTELGSSENNQRKFIKQGDVLPRATLYSAPNFWQRMGGATSLQQVATVWKLIAYESDSDNGPYSVENMRES